VLYIESSDFREQPPKGYFRLSPGAEVRLRYAYIIKCVNVVKDTESGEVIEVHCVYYPETRSGLPASSKKVKGTIHWVSAEHSINVEVRLYDRLFKVKDPSGDNWRDYINPDSLKIIKGCKAEPSLKNVKAQDRFQFERLGYFCVDDDSKDDNIIFNRSVTLRDTWAKIENSSLSRE